MLIDPESIVPQIGSTYPDRFKHFTTGRIKQRLGDSVGLKNFGVNSVKLEPHSCSALRHWHTNQDEFIYIIEGEVTLVTDSGSQILTSGMMAGFPAGEPNAHHLINNSEEIVIYLEVGDRTANDRVNYPDDDLICRYTLEGRIFTHKDGSPFED